MLPHRSSGISAPPNPGMGSLPAAPTPSPGHTALASALTLPACAPQCKRQQSLGSPETCGSRAMYNYIMRRLAFGAATVVAVSVLVFVILRILPGDPLVAIFG